MATATNELSGKLHDYLQAEGLARDVEKYRNDDPRLVTAALEVAQQSKSLMGGLYQDFRKREDSFARRLKNKIIGKIANIVRNTLERSLQTQQRFNDQIYYLTKLHNEKIAALETEITKLKQQQEG